VDCRFFDSEGQVAVDAGVDLWLNGGSLVSGCHFRGAGGGAVHVLCWGDADLVNCIFEDNDVNNIIWADGDFGIVFTVNVVNCTFWGNRGSRLMGRTIDPSIHVRNSIEWNNAGNGFGLVDTVAHSLAEGGAPDPMFSDPVGGDFSLMPGSPAIDAADKTALPPGITLDFAGNPRFIDDPNTPDTGVGTPPLPDIGALEFQGSACPPDLTTSAIPASPGYGIPDGAVNNEDFFYYLAQFAAGNLAVADLTTSAIPGSPGYGVPNGILNNEDFFYYLTLFAAGC
jgi:hypothetical protein